MKVAIFPIPKIVAYPGQIIPLHIFEPRYRRMIETCVNDGIPLGISLAGDKTASRNFNKLSTKEILQKNQESYRPNDIFSAGHVKIIETYPDGRLHIEVNLDTRYKTCEIQQSVPFIVAEVEKVPFYISNEKTLTHKLQTMQKLVRSTIETVNKDVSTDPFGLENLFQESAISQMAAFLQILTLEIPLQEQILRADDIVKQYEIFIHVLEEFQASHLKKQPPPNKTSKKKPTNNGKIISLFKSPEQDS